MDSTFNILVSDPTATTVTVTLDLEEVKAIIEDMDAADFPHGDHTDSSVELWNMLRKLVRTHNLIFKD